MLRQLTTFGLWGVLVAVGCSNAPVFLANEGGGGSAPATTGTGGDPSSSNTGGAGGAGAAGGATGNGGAGASGGAGGSGGAGTFCDFVQTDQFVTAATGIAAGLATGGGNLFISNNSAEIFEVDPVTGVQVRSFPNPAAIHTGIGASATKIYTDQIAVGNDIIVEIDQANPNNTTSFPHPITGNIGDVTFHQNAVWQSGIITALSPDWRLVQVALGTGNVVSTFTLPVTAGNAPPRGLGSDGTYLLYLSDDPTCMACDLTMFVFEANGTEVCRQELPGIASAIDIDSDGTSVFVATSANVVTRFEKSN